MKEIKQKLINLGIFICCLATVMLTACKNDPTEYKMDPLTDMGTLITYDAAWRALCADYNTDVFSNPFVDPTGNYDRSKAELQEIDLEAKWRVKIEKEVKAAINRSTAGPVKPIDDSQYKMTVEIIQLMRLMSGEDAIDFADLVTGMRIVHDETCREAIIAVAVALYNNTKKTTEPLITFQQAWKQFAEAWNEIEKLGSRPREIVRPDQ